MISYKKRAVEGYRNLVKKEINHTSTLFAISDSRKKPYHYTDGFLEFRGQGGVFELEIPRHGGILTIGIPKVLGEGDGGLRLEFSEGTAESVFLENAYFMDFNNQLAN